MEEEGQLTDRNAALGSWLKWRGRDVRRAKRWRCSGRAAMSVGPENGCNARVVYPCGGFCSFRQSM